MTIDSTIPVPVKHPRSRGRNAKYPWAKMKPGDSFKAENWDKENAPKRIAYFQSLGKTWASRNDVDAKFTAGFHAKQLRVWRVR